jgi:two-component system NtrC family sensor kinase
MADALVEAESERDRAVGAMIQSAKLASIGQLAAGIGHELSNPLGNIYSLTKLLQRHLPDDEVLRRDVANIREEAERASHIIKGLLNFARQGPTQFSRFDLGVWLDDTLELVRRMAERKGIELALTATASAEVEADRGLLQQALVDLLVNAIQATPAGGCVQLAGGLQQDRLELSVRDQGPGIPAPAMSRVFDPFFTTKPEGEGTGLGLSIAMGIVERHGGTLELHNRAPGLEARIGIPQPLMEQD